MSYSDKLQHKIATSIIPRLEKELKDILANNNFTSNIEVQIRTLESLILDFRDMLQYCTYISEEECEDLLLEINKYYDSY